MGCSELTVRIKIPNGAETFTTKKLLGILLLTGATFLTGCGNSFEDDFVITNNNGVIVAPVCVDDTYTVNSNTTLTVNAANGVLANDTLNGATITNFATASANGGTVTVNADGSFVYVPQTNFSGSDSFTYTVGNTAGTRTCTVTITVTAVNGFFVDAVNGDDGTGSFTNGLPFATIQAAAAAAPPGSDIIVRAGTYTGAVTLDNGDRLLGEGSVLTQGAAVRPVLTGPVDMADGCTIDFVRIDGTTTGDAINGNNQNGGTITNCEIENIGGGVANSPIELRDVRGIWDVSDNMVDTFDSIAIDITTSGTDVLEVTVSGNQISNGDLSGISFFSDDTADITAFVIGNTLSNNNLVTGNSFELQCLGDSTFCLDLESNTNDDVYRLLDGVGSSVLSIEQFASNGLTTPRPAGAGNTGAVNDSTGIGGDTPVSIGDGDCSL